ncbi:unnamed protein product, partial [Linum tenue]
PFPSLSPTSLSCSLPFTWFHHLKNHHPPFQKQRVKARKKSISRRGRGRRRRQKGCCQFPSSSETACEKDDSGQSNSWIVLRFAGWVSYFFGYDLTVGIIDMISGSSRKVAGQKGCDTVFL